MILLIFQLTAHLHLKLKSIALTVTETADTTDNNPSCPESLLSSESDSCSQEIEVKPPGKC